MTLLIAALVTGIGLGSMYGLIALGFQITYSVSSTVNFAQGSVVMLGAVLGFVFTERLGLNWLIAYPLAGWAGAALGLPATSIILSALAAVAIGAVLAIWPADDPEIVEHSHDDLPEDHPHLAEGGHGRRHAHVYVIDDIHVAWPRER